MVPCQRRFLSLSDDIYGNPDMNYANVRQLYQLNFY